MDTRRQERSLRSKPDSDDEKKKRPQQNIEKIVKKTPKRVAKKRKTAPNTG